MSQLLDAEAFRDLLQNAREAGGLLEDETFQAHLQRFSSPHSRRCVRQLYKTVSLRRAFEKLLIIPGVWAGMRLSTLHKVIWLRCNQEAARYLDYIHRVWSHIAGEDDRALLCIDAATVEAVQLRCPRFSDRDRDKLKALLDAGQIFTAFDEDERRIIWDRLSVIDCTIPSLFTFFEDVKLLQLWAESMRHFVAPDHQAMRALQHLRDPIPHLRRPDEGVDMRVRRLWVFAMREYQNLGTPSLRSRERLLAKVMPQQAQETTLIRFARLASRLGFQTPQIRALRRRREQVDDLSADEGEESEEAEERHDTRPTQQLQQLDEPAALVVTSRCPAPRRCGLATVAAHEQNRKLISVQNLHFDYSSLDIRGPDITSFFAVRCIYLAFFGHLRDDASIYQSPLLLPHVSRSTSGNASGNHNVSPNVSLNEPSEEGRSTPTVPDSARSRQHVTLGEQIMLQMRQGSEANTPASVSSRESAASWTDGVGTESPPYSDRITVVFRTFRDGRLEELRREEVDEDDPSTVQVMVQDFMQNGLIPFSTELWPLQPSQCFESAMASRVNTIILLPKNRIHITQLLQRAVAQLQPEEASLGSSSQNVTATNFR
ncbi:Fc.00g081780.m01.CDS01 [Cosmosporella sp. VM-42]